MLIIPKIPKVYRDRFFVAFGKHEFGAYAPDSNETVFRAESTAYRVTVNGQACEARHCRVSAVPFNRPWPGKQRQMDQGEDAAYIAFCADEAVVLRVRSEKKDGEAVVRPLSRGIAVEREGEDVVFTLQSHGAYTLEIGGSHGALHIFFDPIKEAPREDAVNYYFGPGLHFPGTLHLRDRDSVYIDREAIVFGSLFAQGARDLHIFGGGVLDNSCEERITEHCYEPFNKGCLRFYDCMGVTIEDVILTNSCTWVLSLFNCDNVEIDGVKIVGQWRYNADGVDIVNSRNVRLRNSFVRAFDDVISIKGIYNQPLPIEHIKVEDCVLWCDWGNTCEVGVETSALYYRDVVFSNCDVIHTAGPALTVACGNDTDVSRVQFENIRVELQRDMLPEVLQRSDGDRYDPARGSARPCLIHLSNERYALRTVNSEDVVRKRDARAGRIKDVVFRNVSVLAEDGVQAPEIRVVSEDASDPISDVVIDGLFFNGERCDGLERFYENYRGFDGFCMR